MLCWLPVDTQSIDPDATDKEIDTDVFSIDVLDSNAGVDGMKLITYVLRVVLDETSVFTKTGVNHFFPHEHFLRSAQLITQANGKTRDKCEILATSGFNLAK